MDLSFGNRLKKFIVTVDAVPEDVYKSTLDAIKANLSKFLKVEAFGLLVEGQLDSDDVILVDEWIPGGGPWGYAIWEDKKKKVYKGQVACAYHIGKSLWIVGDDKEELSKTQKYKDLLCNFDSGSIPKFVHNHEHPVKTSMIFPLFSQTKKRKRPYGVLNLESTEYLTPNPLLKKELLNISESVSLLYELRRFHKLQHEGTKESVDELTKISTEFPAAALQWCVFFASSSKADPVVENIIMDALKKNIPTLNIIHWRKERKPGKITDQIWESLLKCQAGICYLSEPAEDDRTPKKYFDNSNVLFEAGMMETLLKKKTDIFSAWIPIREKNSPKTPFNFGSTRTIIVKRSKDEENLIQNTDEIKRNIVGMISTVFEGHDI